MRKRRRGNRRRENGGARACPRNLIMRRHAHHATRRSGQGGSQANNRRKARRKDGRLTYTLRRDLQREFPALPSPTRVICRSSKVIRGRARTRCRAKSKGGIRKCICHVRARRNRCRHRKCKGSCRRKRPPFTRRRGRGRTHRCNSRPGITFRIKSNVKRRKNLVTYRNGFRVKVLTLRILGRLFRTFLRIDRLNVVLLSSNRNSDTVPIVARWSVKFLRPFFCGTRITRLRRSPILLRVGINGIFLNRRLKIRVSVMAMSSIRRARQLRHSIILLSNTLSVLRHGSR